MELDRRKTGLIMVAVAAFIGIVILLVAVFVDDGSGKEYAPVNVYIEPADAMVEEIDENKMDVYAVTKRSSVEDYWDSIADVSEEEDPIMELSAASGRGGKAGGRIDMNKYENLDRIAQTGQLPSDTRNHTSSSKGSTSQESPRKTTEERMAEYMALRQQMTDEMLRQYTEANGGALPAAGYDSGIGSSQNDKSSDMISDSESDVVPERIEAPAAPLRRSGGISSLDASDDFGSLGISSLDGDVDQMLDTDFSHPFKCMFIREEKIESGQRVTIRLLEDMVVDGTLVPKNTHLMAQCTISSRLQLKVTSIEMNGRIYNMNLDAYDNDGTKGIYCPDVDTDAKDQVKRGGVSMSRRAVTKMGALASELANVGVTIAESIGNSSKRVVEVPSGYTFYLVRSSR